MHILIGGGTGFIGTHLSRYFSTQGVRVSVLTRHLGEHKRLHAVQYITSLTIQDGPYDIIINLAGEPLDKNRWNEDSKQSITHSRLHSTQKIIEYIKNVPVKPRLLITGSAIGFYGNSLEQTFQEDTEPADRGFTHTLCAAWEKAGMEAKEYGVRVCVIRTGIVLDHDAGALNKMLWPFKLGLGAQLGQGNQWMSWIHIQDVVKAINFLANKQELQGPFNFTAPGAVTNKQFTQQLAHALKRPQFLTLPDFVVTKIFGEMAETLLLKGQRVVPHQLLAAGYTFKFPALEEALHDILR